MAEAIARGVIKSGLFRADQLIASDVSADRCKIFEEQLQIKTSQDNAALARESKVLMLCVKPQYMQAALENIGAAMSDDTLIISIAAGIGSRFIEQQLGNAKRWRIVRTMPNTPLLGRERIGAMAADASATPAH